LTYYNKFLIGATKNHELVFANFGVRQYGNEQPKFSASFDTVMPFKADERDLADYVADHDTGWLWEMCDEYNCKPSELANAMLKNYDVMEIIDCSLYPEYYDIDGHDWYFESVGCGQHDTRDEMEEIINIDAYNKLHELWDNYHLKTVDDSVVEQVEKLAESFAEVNEEEWITDYIKRHIEEL
jgi:hypothetical protein